MKKIIFFIAVLLICSSVQAALTYDADYFKSHLDQINTDSVYNPLYLIISEIESDMDAIVAGTADDMDATYNGGSAVTVDTDAITLTTPDASNNVVLAIVQNEASNDNAALTITMGTGATGTAVSINSVALGTDIAGDNWSVNQAGLLTCVGVTATGEIQTNADVLLNGTYDAAWDVTRNQFILEDNAVLGIGGAHDAAADVTFKWDTSNLLIESAAEDTGEVRFGSTNAIDVAMYANTNTSIAKFNANTATLEFDGYDVQLQDADILAFGDDDDFTITSGSAATLTVTPLATDETAIINLGADQTGIDMKWFGATASAYTMWDASANQILLTGGSQLSLNDSVELLIGTGASNAGDFSITGNGTGPLLQIDVVVAGSGEIEIGNDADDVPLKWYGETSGDYVYFNGDDFILEDISLCLGESTQIQFGDNVGTGDITMACTSNVLTFGQVAAGTGAVAFGVDDAGMDVTLYGDTASNNAVWDASDDRLELTSADILADDNSKILLGSDSDFTIKCNAAATLNIAPLATDETPIVNFGSDTNGVDVKLFAATTADYLLWDASDERLEFVGTITNLDDDSDLQIGSDADFVIDSDTAKTLDITPAVSDESCIINVGADTTGIDLKLFASTTGDYVLWDASDEDLKFVGTNLVLDSDSGIENPVVVITDAASYNVTAANSGKVHIIGDLSQNTTINLPAEAAGLYYKFIYAGGAAEAHDHTITSGADANFFIGGIRYLDPNDGSSMESTAVYSDGDSNSKLTLNNEETGTSVELYCDGTNWYLTGLVYADTAPALADQ